MKYLYNTPINMPRGSHYGSDYWIVYSNKLHRQVCLYSMLEYAYFLILEMDSHVEYFCEQPLKITSELDNRKKTIFDFWVYYTDGHTEFQEIKYSSELKGTDTAALRSQEQIKLQKEWCENQNHVYKVITDEEIYKSEYCIGNLMKLYALVVRSYKQVKQEIINELKVFLRTGDKTISDIIEKRIFSKGTELQELAYLFYSGEIEINIYDRPFDYRTVVKLCEIKNTIY